MVVFGWPLWLPVVAHREVLLVHAHANTCLHPPLLYPSIDPYIGLLNFWVQSKKGKTKMPSLVKKWQTIQRELDEEENSSSSEDDRELTTQKRIEEWKQQQLMRYGDERRQFSPVGEEANKTLALIYHG